MFKRGVSLIEVLMVLMIFSAILVFVVPLILTKKDQIYNIPSKMTSLAQYEKDIRTLENIILDGSNLFVYKDDDGFKISSKEDDVILNNHQYIQINNYQTLIYVEDCHIFNKILVLDVKFETFKEILFFGGFNHEIYPV